MGEDNKVAVPKKKDSMGIIILVIILILVFLVGGYLIYANHMIGNQANKNDEHSGNKVQDESLETEEDGGPITESDLDEYAHYISPGSSPSALLYNTSSVDSKKLSAAEKINYIASYLQRKVSLSADNQYNILTEDDVKGAVEKVYGPNTYQRTTFNLGCGDYTFNESDGKYYSKTGCGGSTAFFDTNVVIDSKITADKLEITTAYVFYDGMTAKIYKDFDKTIELGDFAGGNSDEISGYLINYINDNKDHLNHIVYTFESTDGVHYYFKGFTNSK